MAALFLSLFCKGVLRKDLALTALKDRTKKSKNNYFARARFFMTPSYEPGADSTRGDRAENAGHTNAQPGAQPRGQGHTLNHELRNAVLAALGIDGARQLADTLTHFGATQAEREHLLYPLVLDALRDGINEMPISKEAVAGACVDLVRKFPDSQTAQGSNMRSLLKGYLRIAAIRLREQRRETREAATRETAARDWRPPTAFSRLSSDDFVRTELPGGYAEMKAAATRLAVELQILRRPGRSLPEAELADWADRWPATYYEQLGPWPLAEREPGEEG